MPRGIEKNTVESVLDWYELQGICNWVIYQNKPEYNKYSGCDDENESLQRLQYALNDIKNSPASNNQYILRCDPKSKTAKEKPHICFCLADQQVQSISGFPQYMAGNYATKNDIDEIKRMIESREIEDEIDELEPDQPKGLLAGLMQNEQVQTMLVSAITGLISSMALKRPVTALSGIETDIDQILTTLYSKGVKKEHLQKLAEMPTEKIQMLISML
jgi:hypothetical protein